MDVYITYEQHTICEESQVNYWFNFFVLCTMVGLCCGCASYQVNSPLEQIDQDVGYRMNNRTLGPKNSDEMFVILGLSGGGMRAAALDYGVLEYLEKIQFGADNRSLLDEVDIISSSSGASIPAAYYGLFGQEAFLNGFKEDVLYLEIQSQIKRKILNPVHWPRLASSNFSRGDLVVEYFDKQIFHGHTFADMQQQRPFILINATDMGIGSQFSFTQGSFDLICSDLSQELVARAVTASMSFTPAFTPITLKNYNEEQCGYSTPAWVQPALKAGVETDPAIYAAARDVLSYEAIDKRPYIHLLDSGISDNMGIRAPQLAFKSRDLPASQIDRIENGTIKKLVIILVDAKPRTYFKGDLKSKPPSALTSIKTAASRPLANYSYETVNLIKRDVRDVRTEQDRQLNTENTCDVHARTLCEQVDMGEGCYEKVSRSCFNSFGVGGAKRPLEFNIYLVHVSFESLEDQSRRERFQAIPTKLELPQTDIDMLIEIAPELLHEDPEFNHLLEDLDARIVD
jgi:NTE family protein